MLKKVVAGTTIAKIIMALLLMSLVSALMVTYIRHSSRLTYVEISQQQQLKDDLDIEWNKLLTEKSVWTLYRIEKEAKDKLGLREPNLSEVEYIRLNEKAQ